MKNFDTNRYWQVLKWNVLTDEQSLLKKAIFGVTAFLIIQLFFCFSLQDLTASTGIHNTFTAMLLCLSSGTLFAIYFASGILGNARTQSQRIGVLMLPASNSEKFTARLTYCLVILPLLIAVCLLAATGLRMLLEVLMGHQGIYSGLPMLFGRMEADSIGSWISYLWSMSAFVLGGVLFKKNPCLWTWVALFAIMMAIAAIAVIVFHIANVRHLSVNTHESATADAVITVITAALTVFNFWMSYRLFKRLQIVQHKWFNV